MNKKPQLRSDEPEMRSVNENIYDMFSIAELEERLQMSALFWGCGNVCSTVCPCNVNECPSDFPPPPCPPVLEYPPDV
ncbi:MAG: hypothetical protein JNM68_10865 [Dinghuibacter sp.]|nr:hypothetical protein [Dinghuibacter sp.]